MMTSLFRWAEGRVDPFADYAPKTPEASAVRYVMGHMSTFRGVLWWAALAGAIVATLELGLIWYAGRLVDLMSAGPATFWQDHSTEILVAAVLLLLLRPIAIGVNAIVLFSGISTNMMAQVRWRAHRHLLGQPVGFFQSDFAGRLANRVMSTGIAVEDTAFLVFEAFWQAAAFAVITLLLLTQMSVWIALPMALWILAFVGFVVWFAPRAGNVAEKSSNANSRETGRIVDSYTNIETVKLFAHGAREEAFAKNAMARHRLRFAAMMRLFATQQAAMAVFNSLALLAVVGPALALWSHGVLSIGEVAAAIAMALRLNTMTGWIMWMTVRTFEHFGTIREGLQSIAVPQSVQDKPGAKPLLVSNGVVQIEGLTHHYGRDTGGLSDVTLRLRGGERIGLVGPSGAGKSSLVNLLLRLRDAETGRIMIDGQNIADVTQDSLRQNIGMVTQDSSLLHRSVRHNLLYGRPDASEAQMVEAAKRAQAHEFIMDLEDSAGRRGYDALVGERGVKLSGGQRQRIAFARVILKNAPILVLDEATSALDSEVEAAIQSTLAGMMQGKTVIAIAHRLSTIAAMDRIVVMEAGRIVEDGAHQDLLDRNGIYARYWRRQSGGFIGAQSGETA